MKRQASDWKKIPQYRYVGLVFKIDKAYSTIISQTTNLKKMGIRFEQAFHKTRSINGQKTQKRCLTS